MIFDVWDIIWTTWILAFGFLEFIALRRRQKGDTLSEHWWQWSGHYAQRQWIRVIGRVVTLCIGVWLTGHMAFELWVITFGKGNA